jgi:hypothetical protein
LPSSTAGATVTPMKAKHRTRKERSAASRTDAEKLLPPGADTADDRLVGAAVSEIRTILGQTLAKGMEQVGAYLLKTFYDDDPALYAAATPTKHASLRKLSERCGTMELPISSTFLSSAIRMAIVSRQLPKGAAFGKLPVSHRVELLRLPTPEKIEATAQTIADREGMTVRKLRAKVTKMLAGASAGRGRPRTPSVVRAVDQLVGALRKEDSWRLAFHRADIDALDDEKRAELEETVTRVSDLLAQLQGLLAKR